MTLEHIATEASTQIDPQAAAEPEADLQQWLHLQQEDISPQDLAADFFANPNKYHPGLHNHLASFLIDQGQGYDVAKNLDKFSSLSLETANQLLDFSQGNCDGIIEHHDKFGLDERQVIDLLIRHQYVDSIYHNLDKFKQVNVSQIIELTRESGQLWLLPEYAEKFPQIITPEVLLNLIEEEKLSGEVADVLPKLSYKLPAEIAYSLIAKGHYPDWISSNLAKFDGLDINRLVKMLLSSDPTSYEGAYEFWDAGLKLGQLTEPLEPDRIEDAKSGLEHLFFDQGEFAGYLENKADYFVENLHKYEDHPLAPEFLKQALKYYSVANKWLTVYDGSFANQPWNDQMNSIAQSIVDAGAPNAEDEYVPGDDWDVDDLTNHPYGSPNMQGYTLEDPYKDHPDRMRGEKLKQAGQLYKYLNGEAVHADEPDSIKKLVVELNKVVELQLDNFKNILENYRFMGDDDKLALVAPEKYNFIITPFEQSVKSLLARYIVQTISPLEVDLQEKMRETNRILNEGIRLFLDVYEKEIPLYDKLYEEFDDYRKNGRTPMEVYLGRDGVYAWLGRRAQDAARRRNLAPGERVTGTKNGEVIEIHPRYLVYPRRFRDALDREVKGQYLGQHGIKEENDPLFYDTGYTGTIPEDIMRVMGFSQDEIEARIRLLSANQANRRVRGVSENARGDIIEFIEYNPKLEEPAEGLTLDEKTGKIRHIAKPTSPKEQFKFGMIRQAIVRHYWLKERLHHKFDAKSTEELVATV